MQAYFPYDVSNPQSVFGEQHTIVDGRIRLRHIPQANTIQIQDFVEAFQAAGLQANEFYCAYSLDTQYRESNRIVCFSTLNNDKVVLVNYKAVGTPVTADDMNEIKNHVDHTATQLVNFAFALDRQSNDIQALQDAVNGISTVDLDTHDQSHNAHQFIQGLIQTEESARQIDVDNLQDNIDAEISNRQLADNALSTRISALENSSGLSPTQDDIDELEQRVAALENSSGLSPVQDDIDELSRRVSSLELAGGSYSTKTDVAGLSQRIDNLQTDLGGLSDSYVYELATVHADLEDINNALASKMTFGGNSTAAPVNPTAGTFAFIDGLPYVHDGNQWILLKGGGNSAASDPTIADVDFVTSIFNNKPHANYSALGKTDFLTYVLGDNTPTNYSESGGLSKADFIDYVFGGASNG